MYIFENIPMLMELLSTHEQVDGVVIRGGEEQLPLSEIKTVLSPVDYKIIAKRVFGPIHFLKNTHGIETDMSKIYNMLMKAYETDVIFEENLFDAIAEYLDSYILYSYQQILGKEDVRLGDLFDLYNIKTRYIHELPTPKKPVVGEARIRR